MRAADMLRAEMAEDCPFTKQQFIDAASDSIRRQGYYGFGLSSHWSPGWSLTGSPQIPGKYLRLVQRWCYEEGFMCKREVSYYGVPNYWVELDTSLH